MPGAWRTRASCARARRLVDDRFVFSSPHGVTSDKEALIANLFAMGMAGQTVRECPALVEGDVALVFGTADLRFAGPGPTEATTSLRYAATDVRRPKGWRMPALQMQPRAPEA